MKSNRLFWLVDESFFRDISEVREHFDGIELLTLTSLGDLFSHTGEADCILASVPLSPLEVELLSAVPVIVWRDEFPAADAARAIHAGAFHCFDASTPVEDVRDAVGVAMERNNARAAQRRRMSEPSEKWRASLVGESAAMNAVAEVIRLVAPKRCTVLISGETGTGKEMVARAIHMASPRAHLPMVSVNCTALPENLLEAELFGHTKGAFTGATGYRVGRFEQAHKGTLFLDEIGDMPLELQAKLLRVLQEKEFQRLGCSETIKVDVRVIAASNVDLIERVRQGKFRADLYYRLNVVPLATPPLRSRKEDIPALVAHFVTRVCRAEDIDLKRVAPMALDSLCAQPWPGNIRQLENTIEMAIALSGERDVLTVRDFGLHAVPARTPATEMQSTQAIPFPATTNFEEAISQFEFTLLNSALRECAGNKTVAAERLGIKRTTLIMKLKNLEKSRFTLTDAAMPVRRMPDSSGLAPVEMEAFNAA